MLISKVLPVFLATVLRVWNPSGTLMTATLTLTTSSEETSSQQITVPPLSVVNVPVPLEQGRTATASITSTSEAQMWATMGGVEFFAQQAKTKWTIPANQFTGIAIGNPSRGQATIYFQLMSGAGAGSLYENGGLAPGTIALMMSWLFREPVDAGTLLVTSDIPLALVAAECPKVCSSVPVQ